mgnify:CR=1 FL=1
MIAVGGGVTPEGIEALASLGVVCVPVVERPVSIVRELLDNAIDAGATRITLETEDGGIGLIRVTDNGRGIAPEQVELVGADNQPGKIEGARGGSRQRRRGLGVR